MKQPISLQKRLGLGLTLGLVVLWLVATALTAVIVSFTLNKTLDSSLEEVGQRILSLAVVEIINRETPDLLQQVASLRPHEEYLTYLVSDAKGTPLLKSHAVDLSVFTGKPQLGFRNTSTHRIYGTSAISDTIFIEVAEPLSARYQAQGKALILLLLPLAILIPLSLVGVWWFVRHSLRGVLAYRNALEARGVNDLSLVDSKQLPTEILPIAESVNHLLKRLRLTLEAERSFTANSAHELRTPLAAALAQIQRLKAEAPLGPLQNRASRIEMALKDLTQLSEKLMQLAKAESGSLLTEKPYKIVKVLHYVLDEFRSTAASRLQLTTPEGELVFSSIDPDAFAILVRNLIENALKHGVPGQPVEIKLTAEGDLRIINAGPVIPVEELQHLTERFVRSKTLASGSGLGLAIAQTIAVGAGTSLRLASPATGREDGFEVSLSLP